MLFALALGVCFGAAAVVLLQQWLRGSLMIGDSVGRTSLHADHFAGLTPRARAHR